MLTTPLVSMLLDELKYRRRTYTRDVTHMTNE